MSSPRVSIYYEKGRKYPRACWSEGGEQKKFSLGTTDKALIKAWTAKKERELLLRHLGLSELERRPTTVSLEEAMSVYFKEEMVVPMRALNTVKDRRDRLAKIKGILGPETPLDSIDSPVLVSYRNRRLQSAGPTTVHHDLIAILSLLRCGQKRGWIREVPQVELPKPSTHRGETIPVADVEKILRGLDLSNSTERALWFGLNMGLREGDIKTMRGEDWDKENAAMKKRCDKTGAYIVFPLPWESWKLIGPHIPDKGPVCPRILKCGGIKLITNRLCDAEYGIRMCRPTWSTAMDAAGVENAKIKRLMAHSTQDVTQGYITRDMEVLRAETSKLPWRNLSHFTPTSPVSPLVST